LIKIREKIIFSSLIFILKIKIFALEKSVCVQLFREKVLILLKDKRNFKFLIIANGGKPLRTVANARERLFAVRFLKLRMARIA
jgi:hypothetical protein